MAKELRKKVKKIIKYNMDKKTSPNKNLQEGYNEAAVTTTPAKKGSPYKMGGMAFKGDQDPMSGKTASKASPNKELITATIATATIISAAVTGIVAIGNWISGANRRKREAKAANVSARNQGRRDDRKNKQMAEDKVLAGVSKMGDRSAQRSAQAKSTASPKWM